MTLLMLAIGLFIWAVWMCVIVFCLGVGFLVAWFIGMSLVHLISLSSK
ncbi:hypothetical protein BCCR75502_07157 (plasmid) [Burkholderia sola]|nr:hypothetical protein BCCR12632_07166 [Burkholderia cenocepacia]CAG2382135.1 hypothetical protein BCCR75388_07131 [Burkholderia cenocepacia]CAG2382136.1 hypothetical protein BCCR75389_07123 [Burkholderia cenocepacia]CAG2382181.1 hypothetical protein BCCR75384_07157 [Burkholderia cenocepacia]CAG2382250.1 hypothetical protein BCCR75387_07153 [Burkholderia cenocepacia]